MSQGEYDIVVSSPRIDDEPEGPDLVILILAMGLFYLMLGYAAVSWLFKPIKAIRTGAAEIGRGNFNHRIATIRSDQLGDLAGDINRLAGDVESMLDAKRALLLGISHELRTPLSRMNLALELLDSEDDRETMKAEVNEMEKIIVSLLEAERLSTRHEPLSRSSVRIDVLVDDLIEDFFDRDRNRLQIQNIAGHLVVAVDEARIVLLLKNLVSNALRYSSPESGPVVLEIAHEDRTLVLRVSDHGPGLSREQALRLGEPFYR
jgi:signal transduction histidine kinase